MSRGKDTSELKPRDRNLSGHISNRDETNEPDSKAFVRDSKNEKEEATKFRPNCDGDDDVFSSGEEEAMQRTAATRTCQGTSGRRLSSLDIYQLNHKEENVNYVLKGKESLQDVIEEVNEFEKREANELTEEQRRRLASNQKRAEVMIARIQKNNDKRRESLLRDLSEAQSEKLRHQQNIKKFGGLTREKRARLKQLLMQKAKEEFRNEQREQMRARENHLKKVCPPICTDNMDDAQLLELVKALHVRAVQCEAEKLEWEERLKIQADEIHALLQEIQEKQGRFLIPVLRKVKRK